MEIEAQNPANLPDRIADFHVRLGALEQKLEAVQGPKQDSLFEDMLELLAAGVALYCCFYGFGLPNHNYQWVFAALITAALYHKQVFPMPRVWYDWILLLANVLFLAMLLKIVIGGGDPKPLHWLQYPTIEGGLSSFTLKWLPTSAAEWAIPLTTLQTFLLVLVVFALLIGFEIFASLLGFLLMVLAIPSLVSFDWSFALPGMIAAMFTLYLQVDRRATL